MADSQKSPSKEIISLAKETLESSSVHGIGNIIRNRFYFIKIIWVLCVLASTGVASWLIQKMISDYLNYDVISKTTIKFETKLVFPIVSICNLNPFTTDYANQIFLNISNENPDLLSELEASKLKHVIAKLSNQTSLGSTLDATILKCQFNFEDCDLATDFEQYYDINYGNCFRYNSGKTKALKYATDTGSGTGLDLEFYVGDAGQNQNFNSFENGVNIFVSNESIDSAYLDGVRVSTGSNTNIVLTKYSLKKQPKPYSECTADLDSQNSYKSPVYQRLMSYSDRKYHFIDCYYMCFQKYLGDQCGCQDPYYDYVFYPDMKICFLYLYNITNITVINQELKSYYDTFSAYFDTENTILQGCDCPFECEVSDYNYAFVSSSDFPTLSYYMQNFQNNSLILSKFGNETQMSYENVRKSVAMVSIYYNHLRDTQIVDSIKTQVFDLVSSIGGLLGLFLGFSFLSLIELVEIGFQSILIWVKKSAKKKILFRKKANVKNVSTKA
jgi:hypothetical protein